MCPLNLDLWLMLNYYLVNGKTFQVMTNILQISSNIKYGALFTQISEGENGNPNKGPAKSACAKIINMMELSP